MQSFKYVENAIAAVVGIAAPGWIIQRLTNEQTTASNTIDGLALISPWTIILLCALPVKLMLVEKKELFGRRGI